MYFAKFAKFSAIISWHTFLALSSTTGTQIIRMLDLFVKPHFLEALSIFHFIFSLSFRSDNIIVLYSSSSVLSFVPSILMLNSSTELFYFSYYIFSVPFGT